jgi:hypothetical protein
MKSRGEIPVQIHALYHLHWVEVSGHLRHAHVPSLPGELSRIHLAGGLRGGAVVEALRYKPEGRGFDSLWCHWIFY